MTIAVQETLWWTDIRPDTPAPADVPLRTPPLSVAERQALLVDPVYSVYWLMNRGYVGYVGRSLNPAGRIAHHNGDKVFETWHAITVDTEADMIALEADLIHSMHPPYNKRCEKLIKTPGRAGFMQCGYYTAAALEQRVRLYL